MKKKVIKERIKQNGGITLLALVITIIVLLILAGVSIGMIVGDGGIIGKANDAKLETEKSDIEERCLLHLCVVPMLQKEQDDK